MRDLSTIAFFRTVALLRRHGPVPGILATRRSGAIMDKSGRPRLVTFNPNKNRKETQNCILDLSTSWGHARPPLRHRKKLTAPTSRLCTTRCLSYQQSRLICARIHRVSQRCYLTRRFLPKSTMGKAVNYAFGSMKIAGGLSQRARHRDRHKPR
jgi:hypothetical protein